MYPTSQVDVPYVSRGYTLHAKCPKDVENTEMENMHLSLEQVSIHKSNRESSNLCPPSRSESPLAAYGSFLRSFGHLKKNVSRKDRWMDRWMEGQMDGLMTLNKR